MTIFLILWIVFGYLAIGFGLWLVCLKRSIEGKISCDEPLYINEYDDFPFQFILFWPFFCFFHLIECAISLGNKLTEYCSDKFRRK